MQTLDVTDAAQSRTAGFANALGCGEDLLGLPIRDKMAVAKARREKWQWKCESSLRRGFVSPRVVRLFLAQ